MTDADSSPTTPPTNVIHSAPSPPTISPVSNTDTDTTSPKSKFVSIFSPRSSQSKPPTPLLRIFSPSAFRRTSPFPRDQESESSSSTTTPPASSPRHRLKQSICQCFSTPPEDDDSIEELEYGNHLRNLEPTYQPEDPLLPTPLSSHENRICLVLDLDETLVHSSFTPIAGADFEIPLEMQGELHTVYVKKRPGVDNFLKKASEWYEIVMFTASLALYANPVMDLLDPHNLVHLRLYREHCVLIGGCYVKDISRLGRDLRRTFIIDNSPLSYVFQPENAIPITAFFTDENDRELDKTLALLEQARHLKDVRKAFS